MLKTLIKIRLQGILLRQTKSSKKNQGNSIGKIVLMGLLFAYVGVVFCGIMILPDSCSIFFLIVAPQCSKIAICAIITIFTQMRINISRMETNIYDRKSEWNT